LRFAGQRIREALHTVKITALKTYIVPSEISETPWCWGEAWVLVKLETDDGIEGWGEAHAFSEREQAVATEVQKLSRVIDGMDPFCIKRFMTIAHDTIGDPRGGIEVSSAAAGIEIALWDIVGKALGTPIHKFLGGPCRARIGVYANCWSHESRSSNQIASYAAEQVERGFRAVKIYPFLYDNTAQDGIECLRTVCDAVGPDVSVFVDMWDRLHPEDLPVIVDALHAHGISWFEDPANANDVNELVRIRTQSKLPVVSGETLYSKQEFVRLLEYQAADILNPDITCCGILGIKEIAAVAEAYSTNVSVHNNNSMTIGLAAGIQAAAVVPNLALVEYFPRFVEGSNTFSSFPGELDDDGCIALSNEPGLGVGVDKAVVAAMEYNPVSHDR
jgi:galactonate dehydratase